MRAYRDRNEGGIALAERLREYRGADVVVLGLPRGGAVTARVVADALGAPMDLAVVRKIGHPENEEYALGAVGEEGEPLMDEQAARLADPDWLRRETARQTAEAKRRRRVYLGERAPLLLAGKTVILVDDGLATGFTMTAAALDVRKRHPRRLIAAAPVGSREAVDRLRTVADAVVVDQCPNDMRSVGQWYEEFAPVEDDAVVELMRVPLGGTSR